MLADPGIDAVIVLFVPPVVATTADVAAAIARASAGADKPVLPVVISADGGPAGASPTPSRQRGRSGSPLGVRRGCGVRRRSHRISIASIRALPS